MTNQRAAGTKTVEWLNLVYSPNSLAASHWWDEDDFIAFLEEVIP